MTIQNMIAALPGGTDPVDQVSLRAALLSGLGHFIEPDTDPQTVDVVDGDTGAFPWLIFWHEHLWWYDPDDTTTAHDGTTTIVAEGGGRYKVSEIDPWHGYAVISSTVTDPPSLEDSPPDELDFGDAYIVPAGASGDWGDHEDEIAIWTARGWGYVPPRKGRLVHVNDEDAFRHWTGTEWQLGLGNSTFADDSIAPIKLIQGLTNWIVETISQNDPPSIVKGVNYVVGPSPTGAFTGHTNKIATSDDGTTWAFYTPTIGWRVFAIAESAFHDFDGTQWVRAGGQSYTFSATGADVWDKPTFGTFAFFQLWGAGGAGGRISGSAGAGGGAGGACTTALVPLALLPASLTTSVGAGGAARTTNGIGDAGGSTSVSASGITLLFAGGGGGGGGGATTTAGGGGGGGNAGSGTSGSAGASVTPAPGGAMVGDIAALAEGTPNTFFNRHSGPGSAVLTTMRNQFLSGSCSPGGPGGTGTASTAGMAGGNSAIGGGGGGSVSNSGTAGVGGGSLGGGNGGDAARGANASNGVTPGGGGGACHGADSGAGGNGLIIITVF